MISSVQEKLLSLLYPRHCPVCHDIVLPRGALVCPDCVKKITFVSGPVCLRCGKPIAAREIEYCYDCSRLSRPFARGFALAVYDDIMRDSMRRFKNRGRIEYADWYAAALWKRCGREIADCHIDIIVPVPLHPGKRRKRGYNQAEELARRMSPYLGVKTYARALARARRTTAQKYLTADERQKNLETAFCPGRQIDRVRGQTVLLVDDIYTTGATASECTRVLLEAGAKMVYLANVCIGENDA